MVSWTDSVSFWKVHSQLPKQSPEGQREAPKSLQQSSQLTPSPQEARATVLLGRQQFTITFCLAFVMASLNMSVETFTLPDKGLMLTHSAQTFFQKLPAGLSWSTVTKFSSSVRFVCWMKSTEVFTFFTFFNIFSHFTFGHFLSMSLRFCRTWKMSSSLKANTICNTVSWCHLRVHVRDVSEDGKLHFLCLRPVEISTRAKPRAWCLSELRKSSEIL